MMRKTVLLLTVCMLTGCGQHPEPDPPAVLPVRTVQTGAELTGAAADMLMQSETALQVSMPDALFPETEQRIAAAVQGHVLARTLLDTVTWTRQGNRLHLSAVYTDLPETVREKKQALSAYAEDWAESAADFPAAVQALLAHDRLCAACCYDADAPDCGSAYGAWMNGRASCAGYAEGYALLLESVGIPVRILAGTVQLPDGRALPHAWNLVYLDGSWYHTDCTWDDTADADGHAMFLCDDAAIADTHAWNPADCPQAAGGVLRYETVVQQMQEAVRQDP